jgi:hypothetical protein
MYRLSILAFIVFLTSCIKEDHFGSSSENKMLTFALESQVGNTQIDQEMKTVNVVVSADASIITLEPT